MTVPSHARVPLRGARRTRTGASDHRAGPRAGRSRVGAPRAPSFLPGRVCLPASRAPEPPALKPSRRNNTPQTARLKQAPVPPDLVPAGLVEACPARVPQLLRRPRPVGQAPPPPRELVHLRHPPKACVGEDVCIWGHSAHRGKIGRAHV